MDNIIRVKDLRKSYGDNQVLNGVSFDVKHGEILALLGVNGAGKSTTLECIEGVRKYNSGEISVDGLVGVQLQTSSLIPECKVKEVIRLFSLWQKSPEINLEPYGIAEIQNKKYKSLSGGQKKKLHLALAMIGDPDIIILDEPTAGLDVKGQIELHNDIRKLRDAGKTILISSHDMAEVEELCDRIAILKNGTIAFIGAISELKNNSAHDLSQVDFKEKTITFMVKTLATLPNSFDLSRYTGFEQGYYSYDTEQIADALYEILTYTRQNHIKITDIQIKHTTLEQRFMEVLKET